MIAPRPAAVTASALKVIPLNVVRNGRMHAASDDAQASTAVAAISAPPAVARPRVMTAIAAMAASPTPRVVAMANCISERS
ncbi:Uncharacterised protein [Mycobacteroides abscessus subsp. abscessus]|nr:Uncharacterised protein [Mycobacteroides abscessus subsp. abscessus]